MAGVKKEKSGVKENKAARNPGLVMWAWIALLVGGLGHMMPTQLSPVLSWGVAGVSLQMAVGVVSVVLALYFLLED